ncbi:RNA polymerase sigma factor [Asticcacaulis benevestitus]|uniref:RNA polymerase subunit sigma-24 n=1 Tax=Asticcacaulis benevestitus DSM 16100 = ATCC BAA-896 TaxID=1121022 RepID=V4PWF2_9CAUL|nr:sigma-70 family RNA polymerase sigma factor [Asticcacaulis benevestitus]ESQ92686.1 RNA polymerase subunit sigma-24 [Asticcacaulis benevestitus DSM 16100 = ATCC BAA-896]
MESAPRHIVEWVGSQILPHERDVRAWLRRARMSHEDVEDILQEAYCKMAELATIDHITSPRGYFFTVAKNIAFMRLRRARIVRIESVDEIDRLDIASDAPSPEQITAARSELSRLKRLIDALPERCRRIFEMRRIQGVAQKEIARVMGVTETIVENETAKALRLIMRSMAAEDGGSHPQKEFKRGVDAHRN